MRSIVLLLFCVLVCTTVSAQVSPEWERVYTFDDGIIEMNTSLVTLFEEDVGRVRFKTIFDQPMPLEEKYGEYKSRLEVVEFHCGASSYRPQATTWFDSSGKMIRHEAADATVHWTTVASGSMTEKLYFAACQLIYAKLRPKVVSPEAIAARKAEEVAFRFTQRLDQAKDFKPVIKEFFAADFLGRYLADAEGQWFQNLTIDTAAKLSNAELERFYVALLNAAYLSGVYLVSQQALGPRLNESGLPADVIELIKKHPYTTIFGGATTNLDFLADRIDSVERLRTYTELLERIGGSMRKHVEKVNAHNSREYKAMFEGSGFFDARPWMCRAHCLGFPAGTKVFDVDVPIFRLQLAEVDGGLKVISVKGSFQ